MDPRGLDHHRSADRIRNVEAVMAVPKKRPVGKATPRRSPGVKKSSSSAPKRAGKPKLDFAGPPSTWNVASQRAAGSNNIRKPQPLGPYSAEPLSKKRTK